MIRPGAILARWHWRTWPVQGKLMAALLVPTLVALVFGLLQIQDQAGAAPGYTRISQIVGVQQKLSGLIGAIQRERDLAAEFVAAGRAGDRLALEEQFRVMATRSAEVQTAAEQIEELETTGYPAVLDQLGALRPLRQSVLIGTSPVEVVVTEYGAALDPLIALDAGLVRELDDGAVAHDAAAVHALLVSREQVSRQRAIVAAALAVDRITAPQIDEVRAATVRLDGGQDAFVAALGPAERAGYLGQAVGEAELSRQRLLQLMLNRGSANRLLDVSSADWGTRSDSALGDLTSVENELRQRIDRTALALRDDARTAAGWSVVLLILALGLGVVIALLIARSILGPLDVLKRAASEVAGRWLPAAIVRVREGRMPDQGIEPIAVSTREEIGQVARAFDEVHREVMRLAAEQAQLRARINDIFVNLSRRSQGLVERQLQLIDRLEQTEQDAGALSNLFQLDHLATRMRRNNDNLLVIAGTEGTKRSGRPVRLIDVLRAAVSEIEQYQRLTLRKPPDILVLGRAAGDLVHLLAELLDNATQFSPPDTRVIVCAQLVADGSVTIEVADRGVGMTEPEFADTNARLASTPVVDISAARRMGLFVVGRLAVRHGIGVRLRRGEDNLGVCASVSVPAWLVRSVSEIGESPALLASLGYRGSAGGSLTNGDGTRSPGAPDPADSPLPRRGGDRLGGDRPGGDRAVRSGSPPVPPSPPPVPPGPPVSPPPDLPGTGSGGDLFRPVPAGAGAAPAGPRPGVTLQHSTPIFDDVASAWFREYQAVPVGWAAGDPPKQPAGPSAAPAGAPVLAAAGHQVGPAADARHDWGAADEGWRAARALTSPVSAELTAAGLPRRQPRALLMPGAAKAVVSTDPTNVPMRSAELIRGRLASYQQGIREGRRTRHNRNQDDQDGPGSPSQNAAEETE